PTQPFSEIEAVLYAGPVRDPAQVVLATRALPLPGRTVRQLVTVGGDKWLLEVAANRPLVGTVASAQPLLLLLRGLILIVLVTTLVEVLRRRRAYALALVDERTAALEQQARALGRDRERLAEAQRITHIGSWEWEAASDVLTWSDEMYRILGADPAEVKPSYAGYLGRVHDGDRDKVRAAIADCQRTRQMVALDYRVVRPGGEVRWLSCEGLAEVDEAGRLLRLRGTAQDVTGRRRGEGQFRDLL